MSRDGQDALRSICRDFESAKMFQTEQFSSIASVIVFKRHSLIGCRTVPFTRLRFVCCRFCSRRHRCSAFDNGVGSLNTIAMGYIPI
jgi:hypothetical protein